MNLLEKIFNKALGSRTSYREALYWKEKFDVGEIVKPEINDKDEIKYYTSVSEEIIKYINNNDKVLEIGCGSGSLNYYISKKRKIYLTLLDKNIEALNYALEINKSLANIIITDARKINFEKDEYFDFIHTVGLIEHFEDNDIYKILSEIHRLLTKDGYAFVAVPNFFNLELLKIWKDFGKGNERYISTKKLRSYAKKSNFKVVKSGKSKYTYANHKDVLVLNVLEKYIGKINFGFLNFIVIKKL